MLSVFLLICVCYGQNDLNHVLHGLTLTIFTPRAHSVGIMTRLAPDHLSSLSDGFLSLVSQRPIGAGALIQGRYDPDHFSPALFAKLGIARPDSLARAIDKRLAEFLAGRCMARIAQEALGTEPAQIGIGDDRAPVWPHGIAGSISHARGHCACLVLPFGHGAPGIDIEAIASDHALESILRLTVNKHEAALIDTAPTPATMATLVFSAKETLFKALFPTVQRHFGFSSARLAMLPQDGILRLELTEALHPALPEGATFDIRYETGDSHVLTWMLHKG